MNQMQVLKQLISNGGNPKQIVMNLISSSILESNPMIQNLLKLVNSGKDVEIETFAKNIFKEHGRDFDKEFNEFMGEIK